jgi:hypothetical protein
LSVIVCITALARSVYLPLQLCPLPLSGVILIKSYVRR